MNDSGILEDIRASLSRDCFVKREPQDDCFFRSPNGIVHNCDDSARDSAVDNAPLPTSGTGIALPPSSLSGTGTVNLSPKSEMIHSRGNMSISTAETLSNLKSSPKDGSPGEDARRRDASVLQSRCQEEVERKSPRRMMEESLDKTTSGEDANDAQFNDNNSVDVVSPEMKWNEIAQNEIVNGSSIRPPRKIWFLGFSKELQEF